MKWKIKQPKDIIYVNEFLVFPRKFNGYWYWLEWVTVRYFYLGWRYQNIGDIVKIGKHAKELTKNE